MSLLTGTHCKENRNQTRRKPALGKMQSHEERLDISVTKARKQQRETIIGVCN